MMLMDTEMDRSVDMGYGSRHRRLLGTSQSFTWQTTTSTFPTPPPPWLHTFEQQEHNYPSLVMITTSLRLGFGVDVAQLDWDCELAKQD
jgi:hypothetical protein